MKDEIKEGLAEDKAGELKDSEVIQIRKDKIVGFVKEKYNWISYVVLTLIVFLAVRIRTRNLYGLKDITTNTWTLGPDLDPFLFLRWAKYIVANGSLFAVDMMRYSPLGLSTGEEYLLLPYTMAWFHKVAVIFGSESVTHSAVLYPVFFFAITVIAFFFLVRKIFVDSVGEKKANVIALIASFFLSVMPSLLPRTIAGIPEKESAAFFFLFMAFYFFLSSWKAKKVKNKILLGVLAGAFSAGMANIWGGYVYIFTVIGPTLFIAFLLGKVGKEETYAYSSWMLSTFALMILFSSRYSIRNLLASTTTGVSIAALFIVIMHFAIYNTKIKSKLKLGRFSKVPPMIISSVISIVILILLGSIYIGPSFIPNEINGIVNNLVKPATSRLIQTVAENKQPYFGEWAGNFGPIVKGFPLTFWLFFVGSVYLFNNMIKTFKKKERVILTASYVIFLVSMIFSRYSSNSSLNGENFVSLAVYGLGAIVFVGSVGYYYYKYYKEGLEDKLKSVDFGLLLVFMLFFLSIISARGAIRLVMMLVPPASIIISYFVVMSFSNVIKIKEDDGKKIFGWILVGIVIIATIFSGFSLYKNVNAQASVYIPSVYTQQWQLAMSWVRENTPENAVFGHWWDYGYWLQSIGERATVLDGGNVISYWNHLMGRYALTGSDNREALEFLYAHNTTHFLIDSSDIGKYGAYSSIGSDINYDRVSYISSFGKDNNQVLEKKNSTVFVYSGGAGLDDDIVYEDNGSRIFLPSNQAGVGAIVIERDDDGTIRKQPLGVYVYNGQQYTLPLRYIYDSGEFKDFGSGVEAGVYLYPRLISANGGLNVDIDGSLLYLSKRTVKSQFARLYLYNEDNTNFKLVHSEDDIVIKQIKSQNPEFSFDIVNYQGIRGPIRIWEIEYPEDIKFKEEYLSKEYPRELYYATR